MSASPEQLDELTARAAKQAKRKVGERVNGVGHESSARPKVWVPSIVTASDLDENPPPPPEWIVPDVVPAGLIVFAGRPKAGKSILALDLAIATSGHAESFLGHRVERPGDVLYLDLENGQRRIYDRLKFRLMGKPLPSNLHFITEWQAGNRVAFTALLDAMPELRLVVIDIWSKFRAPINRQEDRYQQDQRELHWLAKEAQARHIAIVVVAHLIKGEAPDDPYSAVGGSTAVTGNADAIYMLRRLPGGDGSERSLRFIGRDLDDTDWTLAVTRPIGFAFKCEASESVSDAADRYLAVLRSAGASLTGAEVSRRLGVSRQSASDALNRLVDRGLAQNPYGGYSLTERGAAYASSLP